MITNETRRLHARVVQGALGSAEAQDVERHDASVMNSGEADGGPKPTSQHSPSLHHGNSVCVEMAVRSRSARVAVRFVQQAYKLWKWIQYPLDLSLAVCLSLGTLYIIYAQQDVPYR